MLERFAKSHWKSLVESRLVSFVESLVKNLTDNLGPRYFYQNDRRVRTQCPDEIAVALSLGDLRYWSARSHKSKLPISARWFIYINKPSFSPLIRRRSLFFFFEDSPIESNTLFKKQISGEDKCSRSLSCCKSLFNKFIKTGLSIKRTEDISDWSLRALCTDSVVQTQ